MPRAAGPAARSFGEALEWTAEVYRAAGVLLKKSGKLQGVADEGGYWPAFASNDVTSPVILLVFAFSDFISVFFSIAGAAGAAGVVAGFSCAKLRPLKAKPVKAITKILIMFFTVSPPSSLLDVIFSNCFKS